MRNASSVVVATAALACLLTGCIGYVETEPPAPRYGVVGVAPGPGYFWADGYWDWRGGAWVWAPGRWMVRPRYAHAWIPGHWQRRGRRYGFVRGHWR